MRILFVKERADSAFAQESAMINDEFGRPLEQANLGKVLATLRRLTKGL